MSIQWSSLFRRKPILAGDEPVDALAIHSLKKSLTVVDLTSFGVAAIIGAGIFSTIGNAAYNGGPAVILLFLFTAVACGFSAICYAEFASMIPAAGSAYTYAYASFGELAAWIIGWDLIMEYAIGNIAVAISWSDYFTGLLLGYGIHVPPYLTMDFLSASRAFDSVAPLISQGQTLDQLSSSLSGSIIEGYLAWSTAPKVLGYPIVCDLPALAITVAITALVYIGIQESKRAANLMVFLKIGVILMVIAVGAFYVNPGNWQPFAPNGIGGILKGISGVFFAYIGFDAISTTAEECKNPQRDLPRSMIYSLIICTVLYIAISLILTGIVSHQKLQVGDPLAFVFGPEAASIPWISGIIAASAIFAMAGVLLVFQMGQPRIWMAMSRDGLLPPVFSRIHPRFKTPSFATIVTGFVVALPALFMNLTEVTDLTSIGTLFAFIMVCGGVLRLQHTQPDAKRGFRIPYIDSRYVFPALILLLMGILSYLQPEALREAYSWSGDWEEIKHRLPLQAYSLGMIWLSYLCYRYRLSLIPVLGLASCGYLISELGVTNWLRFVTWLGVGLVIYLVYGIRSSKLARKA